MNRYDLLRIAECQYILDADGDVVRVSKDTANVEIADPLLCPYRRDSFCGVGCPLFEVSHRDAETNPDTFDDIPETFHARLRCSPQHVAILLTPDE